MEEVVGGGAEHGGRWTPRAFIRGLLAAGFQWRASSGGRPAAGVQRRAFSGGFQRRAFSGGCSAARAAWPLLATRGTMLGGAAWVWIHGQGVEEWHGASWLTGKWGQLIRAWGGWLACRGLPFDIWPFVAWPGLAQQAQQAQEKGHFIACMVTHT